MSPVIIGRVENVYIQSTKWFRYEIGLEINNLTTSVNIPLPDNIIGFSKSAAFDIVSGQSQHGGKLWARKTDKVMTLGMDGQLHDELDVKLSCISTSQINDWPASTDTNVKFGAGFMRTLSHENRNKKEDQHQNDEVIQYADVTVPAAIRVPNAASNDQMDVDNAWCIKIKHGELLMIVEMPPTEKVNELKRRIELQSRTTDHWREFIAENQRLIFNGRVLQNDEVLRSIQHFNAESVIHLTRMSTENRGPGQVNQAEDRIQQNAEMSQIAVQFNQCRIYQRNFDGCVRAAQRNMDPQLRGRHNEPAGEIVTEPKVTDLGELTEQMSNTMMLWSHQLEELGNLLIADPELPSDRSSTTYQQARRLIQNNLDACRYISPQMSQFAKFVIPLARDPGTQGRPLRVVQPRPPQQQQQRQ